MFNDTQLLIRKTAARFADNVLAARATTLDAAGADSDRATYVDNLRQLAQLGFNGLCVDEAYAGAYALAMYELGRGCPSTASGISVSNMVAERSTEVEAGFWLVMRAAQLKDEGKPYAKEAALAKLFATQAGERACRDALQLHGGYGYMRDFPLERYCRDIRITSIYEGTSEIQKLIIAKALLTEEGQE